MIYNFDELVPREQTDSVKYDIRQNMFGNPNVIPMWVADMDFKTPDFIIDAIKKRTEHEIFGYSIRPDSYFTSIVNWVKLRHHWTIQKDWISFSPGIVPAINMAVLAFTKKGDEIIVQPPVYFPFFSAIKNHGRAMIENHLVLKNGRYFMDFDDLAIKLKTAKMLILSNPHNPGGSVWTADELKQLGELCVQNNVLMIADEIHSDLVFKPHSYTPLASISDAIAQLSITFIAPSKTFNLAALSTSSAVISNAELKKQFDQMLEHIHVGSGNVFGTVASIAAYTYGHEWLNQLLEYLRGNLDFAEQFFSEKIQKITMIRPEGTYLLWLDCSKLNLTAKELKYKIINEAGLGLSEGRAFGSGGNGFMRLNIACPRSTLKKALQQLESWANRL